MRRSRAAKAARPARPPRPNRCVWAEVQPAPSACVIAKTIAPRLVVASRAPRRSRPFQRGFRVSAGIDLQCGDRECGCDGEVDVEDHPPVGELGQDAADEDADRCACASDCAPGGERLRPLVALEGGHDDRERRRGEHRCAEALACSSGEEGAGRARHRGGERGRGEDAEAGQEHPASSEQVGGAAAEEEQAAEDERVARDRPADARAGQVEVTREARQRDVHRRDVEDHHQLRDEQDEQQQAALVASSRLAVGGPVAVAQAMSPLRCCGGGVASVQHRVSFLSKSDSGVWTTKADTSVRCQEKPKRT